MILLLSQEYELNVNQIAQILTKKNKKWFRLNGEDVPQKTKLELRPSQASPDGILTNSDGESVRLSEVTAVWNRRRGDYIFQDHLTEGQKKFLESECNYSFHSMYLNLSHAFWMNDYFDEWKAVNKLYQLTVASQVGIKCPDSLVTQSPESAREFFDKYQGNVLTKAISQSGHVPADDERSGRLIYANKLSQGNRDELHMVDYAPTLLQHYIEKEIELRVTVIGNRIFPVAIESQKSEKTSVDWRKYDTENTPYYPVSIPKELEYKIRLLMHRLNLTFGAMDFILTKNGEYVFLEVNPGGQWGWVESMSGHPINEAIAELLIERSGQ